MFRFAEELRNLDTAKRRILATVFLSRMSLLVAVFATPILLSRGSNPSEISIALFLIAISSSLGSLSGGALSDWGISRRLIYSLAFFTCALAAVAAFTTIDHLMIFLCFLAINQFCAAVPTPVLIVELTEGNNTRNRVRLFSFYRLALNLGTAFASAAASVILLFDAQYLLIFEGLALLIVCYFTFSILEDGRKIGSPENRQDEATGYLSRESFVPIFVLCISLAPGFLLYSQFSALPPVAFQEWSFPSWLFPFCVGINALLIIFTQVPIGYAISNMKPPFALGLGSAFMGAGMITVFFSNGIGIFWPLIAVMLFTVGEIIFAPMTNAVIPDIAPEKLHGFYQGVVSMVQTFGLSLGPALILAFWNMGVHQSTLINIILASLGLLLPFSIVRLDRKRIK